MAQRQHPFGADMPDHTQQNTLQDLSQTESLQSLIMPQLDMHTHTMSTASSQTTAPTFYSTSSPVNGLEFYDPRVLSHNTMSSPDQALSSSNTAMTYGSMSACPNHAYSSPETIYPTNVDYSFHSRRQYSPTFPRHPYSHHQHPLPHRSHATSATTTPTPSYAPESPLGSTYYPQTVHGPYSIDDHTRASSHSPPFHDLASNRATLPGHSYPTFVSGPSANRQAPDWTLSPQPGPSMASHHSMPSSTSSQRTSSSPAVASSPATKPPKLCSHCKTTSSPLWRRHPSTYAQLCNACGLYLQANKELRPHVLMEEFSSSEMAPDNRFCTHCQTNTTSAWRKGKDGETLCNACGVYWRLKGRDRPLELSGSKPKKRGQRKP